MRPPPTPPLRRRTGRARAPGRPRNWRKRTSRPPPRRRGCGPGSALAFEEPDPAAPLVVVAVVGVVDGRAEPAPGAPLALGEEQPEAPPPRVRAQPPAAAQEQPALELELRDVRRARVQ